ncbi:MAG: hypothetical protein JWR52_3092 [Marmoricola sp.]|nr:hypothetical protein [Marmoricola sp.]
MNGALLSQMITSFGPVFLFMSVPIVIPLLAVVFGAIADRVSPRQHSEVTHGRQVRRLATGQLSADVD